MNSITVKYQEEVANLRLTIEKQSVSPDENETGMNVNRRKSLKNHYNQITKYARTKRMLLLFLFTEVDRCSQPEADSTVKTAACFV